MKTLISALFLVLTLSPLCQAQEGIKYNINPNWQFGVTAGNFLPFGIVGVRNNYPFSGFFLSHPTRLGHFEYMTLVGNAKGVTYYNLATSLRIDYNAMGVINGFFTSGFSLHRYKRLRTQLREFDFVNVTGVHVGFGFTGEIAGPIHARTDLKFNLSPGKSVYFGVGLVIHLGSSENEE